MRIRLEKHQSGRPVVVGALAALLWCGMQLAPVAHKPALHLNPVVDKLAQGKHVIGVSTSDLSFENARELSRADIDFVRLEMEHGPIRRRGAPTCAPAAERLAGHRDRREERGAEGLSQRRVHLDD